MIETARDIVWTLVGIGLLIFVGVAIAAAIKLKKSGKFHSMTEHDDDADWWKPEGWKPDNRNDESNEQ